MVKKRVSEKIKDLIILYLKKKDRGVTIYEISNMLLINNIPKFRADVRNIRYSLQVLKREEKIIGYRYKSYYLYKLEGVSK